VGTSTFQVSLAGLQPGPCQNF